MEWKDLLEKIDDEKLKQVITGLSEGKGLKDVGVELQKRLVAQLYKNKAADLLEDVKKSTQFKAVRKGARKALEGLKAFGIVPGQSGQTTGNKDFWDVSWMEEPLRMKIKVGEGIGTWLLGFTVPEKGGYAKNFLFIDAKGNRIDRLSSIPTDRENRERLIDTWFGYSVNQEFDVPTEKGAALALYLLKNTRINEVDIGLDDGLYLLTVLENYDADPSFVNEDIPKEIQAIIESGAEGPRDGEMSIKYSIPDAIETWKISDTLAEVLQSKVVVDEEQRHNLALQKFSEGLMAMLQKDPDGYKTYFKLLAYSLLKEGDYKRAKEVYLFVDGIDNPKTFDPYVVSGIKEMAEGLIEQLKKELQGDNQVEEEAEDEDQKDEE